MHRLRRLGTAVASTTALLAAASASASATGTRHTAFVQTDNTSGNQVVAYDRATDGTLSEAGTYSTGGLGGALEGSVVDHLASQASLTYDEPNGLLYAVNAGSDTISVFAVFGDRLALRQVLSSGGSFPVSIAVENGVVYVLNAKEGGSLQGFKVAEGRLVAIPGSGRALGLNPTATPQFTNTPGQVAFSPDGSQLLVTTKANGSDVDVFKVEPSGSLSSAPLVNSLPGAVPFAVSFDSKGNVLVSEAGTNSLASFALAEDGALTQLDSVATAQSATCWVVRADDRFYASNAGSASLSGFRAQLGGQVLAPLGTTSTDGGTVDAAVPREGHFLYVQGGAAGVVDEFAIEGNGALSRIGSVTVPGAVGGEGIVAP
jgi:hypothetical protein